MTVKGPTYKKAWVVEGENLEHDVRRCVSSALSRSEEKAKRTPCGEEEEGERECGQ